jgi:hypothetical protein
MRPDGFSNSLESTDSALNNVGSARPRDLTDTLVCRSADSPLARTLHCRAPIATVELHGFDRYSN